MERADHQRLRDSIQRPQNLGSDRGHNPQSVGASLRSLEITNRSRGVWSISPPALRRRKFEVDLRAQRYDSRRIDGDVALIVMPLDVAQMNRLANSRHLVKLARVCPQVRKVDEASNITFEVTDIDRIKSHKRSEQPPVSLCNALATEKAPFAEQ